MRAELARITRWLRDVMTDWRPDPEASTVPANDVAALAAQIQSVQRAYGLSMDDILGWLATKPVVFSQRDFALWAQKLLVTRADAKRETKLAAARFGALPISHPG